MACTSLGTHQYLPHGGQFLKGWTRPQRQTPSSVRAPPPPFFSEILLHFVSYSGTSHSSSFAHKGDGFFIPLLQGQGLQTLEASVQDRETLL